MTLLPNSEQTGNLDNLAVTRAEFRSEIGILLEYMAQALGSVSGTYTTEVVDPFDPELQGTPTLEIGAEPVTADSTLRIPTTQWVKKSGRYVGTTAPTNPEVGMLWIDSTTNPFTIRAYDGTAWDIVSGVASGTRMLFQQSTAPVGWTKDVSIDNTALRVTAGTVSSGGTLDFTAAFNSARVPSGTVGSTVLSVAQMPAHAHAVYDPGHNHYVNDPGHAHGVTAARQFASSQSGGGDNECQNQNFSTAAAGTGIWLNAAATGIALYNAGGNAGHTHTFTGGNLNLDVRYTDIIIGEKN